MTDIDATVDGIGRLRLEHGDPFFAKALSHFYKCDAEFERQLIRYSESGRCSGLHDLERYAVRLRNLQAQHLKEKALVSFRGIFPHGHDASLPRLWKAVVCTQKGLLKVLQPEFPASSCEYFRGLGCDRFILAKVTHTRDQYAPAEREWQWLAEKGFWFAGRRYLPLCGPPEKTRSAETAAGASEQERAYSVTVQLWFVAVEDTAGFLRTVRTVREAREWLMTFSHMQK